jgi:hypothetical protein
MKNPYLGRGHHPAPWRITATVDAPFEDGRTE